MASTQVKRYRQQLKERLELGEVIICGLCLEPIPRSLSRSKRIKHGGKGGLTVDHILPKSKGGNSNRLNLQPAHNKCNTDKSDYQGEP